MTIRKYFYSCLALVISFTAYSQNFVFQRSIGDFGNATSFYITSAGNFYVTDNNSDEVIKIDTLGNLLKDTGGYGWTESTFDNPVDVFATPLNVYVSDKNNHRIQRFDKDLNFISELNKRNSSNSAERFGYPLCSTTSNQGDLYILDSENKRVIKFNLFGQFIQNFGGFDAGAFALQDPKKLAVSPSNMIYVLDEDRIVIFDQYGNGINIFYLPGFIDNLQIVGNIIMLNNKQDIYASSLKDPQLQLEKLMIISGLNDVIVSSLAFGKNLYVLTKNKILIYNEF